MADNTTLNPGAGGDTIRDLNRQGGATKTQVVQLDIGGVAANAEVLVTAGQQTSANSIPVVIASDQALTQLRDQNAGVLQSILVELRVITQILVAGLNVADDPETLRNDPSDIQRIQQ